MIFFLTLFLCPPASADTVVELPAIVKEGTPIDALMEDPALPARSGAPRQDAGSGTLQQSLSETIPVPVTGTNIPGNVSQFRGLGRSAEDTNVQALGIPLNPPQGGGFDLSVFPQFIWSEYRYRVGPSLGSFDPRGTAGSLTLVPWTQQALAVRGQAMRLTEFASSANLFQEAVAGRDATGHLAAVAGYSSGDAHGPSGAFSGRWSLGGIDWKVHFLATDLDAKTPGIPSYPTPQAHQETVRGIPVLQADVPVGEGGLLKSSVFYDFDYLRYDDPASSALPSTQDRILQYGTENALLVGDWKFGASAREARYSTLSLAELHEGVINLQAGRTIEAGGFLWEPTVRGVGVTTYGVLPEGSLGIRQEARVPGGTDDWYARASYTRHFPSLLNRFYAYPGFPGYPGFQGNPALSPERDYSLVAGGGVRRFMWHASVEAFGQIAQDAQVLAPLDPTTDTEVNAGAAEVASLTPSAGFEPYPWLELGTSMTFAASRVTSQGIAFPGLPAWLGLAFASIHDPRDGHPWELRATARFSSSSVADLSGNLLPAYGYMNLDGRVRVASGLSLAMSLEDTFDQQIFLVKDFPSQGRTFSALLVGEF